MSGLMSLAGDSTHNTRRSLSGWRSRRQLLELAGTRCRRDDCALRVLTTRVRDLFLNSFRFSVALRPIGCARIHCLVVVIAIFYCYCRV